ncbi:MAG: HEAT repeat domain-containing protein [Limnothrix sp. RL_2_0]|nr:HEAT repeat domain-containing protein [Limnothrix sp. RL_2_0]
MLASDERYLPLIKIWLAQVNQLLGELSESQIILVQQAPIQVAAIETIEALLTKLLVAEDLNFELAKQIDMLTADTLTQLYRLIAVDLDTQLGEVDIDSEYHNQLSLNSAKVRALQSLEVIGYTLFSLSSIEDFTDSTTQLLDITSLLDQQLLESIEDTAPADFTGLALTRRVAAVRALGAISGFEEENCNNSCGLLTLVKIIATPSTHKKNPASVELLQVRSAALATLERFASINPRRFEREVLPNLLSIAGTTADTGSTRAIENIAIRTQAAEIANRVTNQLEALSQRDSESHDRRFTKNLGLGDDVAVLALLTDGLKERDETVRQNAQLVFTQQYQRKDNLKQLVETIQKSHSEGNQVLLETAVRTASTVNYQNISNDDQVLGQLIKEIAFTLSDDLSDFDETKRLNIKINAAFTLEKIAPFHPNLLHRFFAPRGNKNEDLNKLTGLNSLVDALSHPSAEIVVRASYALSRYGITLNSYTKVFQTLTRLGIQPEKITSDVQNLNTIGSLHECLLDIVESYNSISSANSTEDQACAFTYKTGKGSEEASVAAAFILGQIGLEDVESVERLLEVLRQEDLPPDLRTSILTYGLSEIAPDNAVAINRIIGFLEETERNQNLQIEIMDVIDNIAPESPEIINKISSILADQTNKFSFETKVLATSVIETVASKVNNFELEDSQEIERSLQKERNRLIEYYSLSNNSSILVCSGVAFALAQIGIPGEDINIVNTLKQITEHKERRSRCKLENLDNINQKESIEFQQNLVHIGAISALGSLEFGHPDRAAVFQHLKKVIANEDFYSAVNPMERLEFNLAALRASSALVTPKKSSKTFCNAPSKNSISVRDQESAINNLLTPLRSDFPIGSNSNNQVYLRKIRSEGLQEIENLISYLQSHIDECSLVKTNKSNNNIGVHVSTGFGISHHQDFLERIMGYLLREASDLYARNDSAYVEITQLLSLIRADSLSLVSTDSIRNYLELLGIRENSQTGLSNLCLSRISLDDVEEESFCATIALLVGILWEDISEWKNHQDLHFRDLRLLQTSVDFLTALAERYKTCESSNGYVEENIAIALGEIGEIDVSFSNIQSTLEAITSSSYPQAQSNAIKALANLKSSTVLSGLTTKLHSSNPEERKNAANTIFRLSQVTSQEQKSNLLKNSIDKELVRKLIDLSQNDDNEEVRQEALFSLGYVSPNDINVVNILGETVFSSRETNLRIVSIYALGEIARSSKSENVSNNAVAFLERAATMSNYEDLQVSALYALADLWPKIISTRDFRQVDIVTKSVLKLTSSKDIKNRTIAFYTISQLINSGHISAQNDWSDNLISFLLSEMNDDNPIIRISVIKSLGAISKVTSKINRDKVISLLIYILTNEQQYLSVRLAACKALIGETENGLCAINAEESSSIGLVNAYELESFKKSVLALNGLRLLAESLRSPNHYLRLRGTFQSSENDILQVRSSDEVLKSFSEETLLLRLLEITRREAEDLIQDVDNVFKNSKNSSSQQSKIRWCRVNPFVSCNSRQASN